MGKYIDLTGMKFGRLTAIRQEGRNINEDKNELYENF